MYQIFEKNVRKFVSQEMSEEKFCDSLEKLPTLVTAKALEIIYEQTKDKSSDGGLFTKIMELLGRRGKIDKERAGTLCKEKVEKHLSYGQFLQLIDIRRKLLLAGQN